MGKWKIYLANFIIEQIWRPFCLVTWGPETKPNTQNFEIQVHKGTPLVKVFWDFVKERFSWPENSFIMFSRYDLGKKSVVRFILGWNFLNKTSNLNFILGLYGK
jgi:hypothetical protein